MLKSIVRRFLMVGTLLLLPVISIGCSQHNGGLIFNDTENVLSVSPEVIVPEGYSLRDLTDEEIRIIFDGFNEVFIGKVMFRRDGSVSGIAVRDRSTGIEIVAGNMYGHGITMFAEYEGTPVISEIHGLSVGAFSGGRGHGRDALYQAFFRIHEVLYGVSLWAPDVEESKEYLEKIVKLLILGDGLDLLVLED